MQSTVYTADILKELQLQLQKLIDADIRRVGRNLLRKLATLARTIQNNTIKAAPLIGNIVDVKALETVFWRKEDTFCTGTQNPVVMRYQSVGISRLVDKVRNK